MSLSTRQRRWLLGSALLITVAAAASVSNQDEPNTEVVQPVKSSTLQQGMQSDSPAGSNADMDLQIDRLKRPVFSEKARDMFVAKSWYVPPPASRVVVRPSAPPISFVYLGKMLEDGKNPTVFLEKQDRVYLVRAGDAFDTNYRVDEINAPVMTLTYLPLNIKQTMQIGEAN